MGLVVPFYAPWRILEELAMLDHLTGGRLEIGFAAGVPQELARVGLGMEEARERFNEALDIIDAALTNPVISYSGKHWKFENLSLAPSVLLATLTAEMDDGRLHGFCSEIGAAGNRRSAPASNRSPA